MHPLHFAIHSTSTLNFSSAPATPATNKILAKYQNCTCTGLLMHDSLAQKFILAPAFRHSFHPAFYFAPCASVLFPEVLVPALHAMAEIRLLKFHFNYLSNYSLEASVSTIIFALQQSLIELRNSSYSFSASF